MPVIDSLNMSENFPDMFVEIDKSVDGMVNRVSRPTSDERTFY